MELVLDEFQTKAIDAFVSGKNIIATANTGSGKTLIATECMSILIKSGFEKKIWYTTPIKALSNEKYNDFRKLFGNENVGLLTGDIKINPDAKIIVATMEILNNSLLSGVVNLSDLSDLNRSVKLERSEIGLVIFDEAHYINDSDRGYVWEESLISLSTLDLQVILLSATISNVKLFKKWLNSIYPREFEVVSNSKRVVPLVMRVLSKEFEFLDPVKVLPDDVSGIRSTKHFLGETLRKFQKKDLLPAIVWILSRKNCEKQTLACEISFTDQEEKRILKYELAIFERQLEVSGVDKPQLYLKIHDKLVNGVACHHAGMNSLLREFVEYLFKKKLVKVVFATETFSVGINFPARSVLFTSLTKPTGNGFRMFTASEFIQMAGRAGRRGIDTTGHVFIIPEKVKLEDFKVLLKAKPSPIESKYHVTYSSVLQSYPNDLSGKSWRSRGNEFENVCKILKEHDLIGKDDSLTDRGRAAACFNDIDPVLAVEILGKCKSLTGREIIRALAVLNCPYDDSVFQKDLGWIIDLENSLTKTETMLGVSPGKRIIGSGILGALDLWAKGVEIWKICDKSMIDEGSLIKEFQKIKNIAVAALRALYILDQPEAAQRVSDAIAKLFRRTLLPDSFHMRN